jgi:hypothetical protein
MINHIRRYARGTKYPIIVNETKKIISQYTHPLTLRQVFYRLVSLGFLSNTKSDSNDLSRILCDARRNGDINPERIIDPSREIRNVVQTWNDSKDFLQGVKNTINTFHEEYSRDLWSTQPFYIIVYLEKEALSRIFEDALKPYQIPLVVARGFSSDSQIFEIANLMLRHPNNQTFIQVYSDHDYSGIQIYNTLNKRIGNYARSYYVVEPQIALTLYQIQNSQSLFGYTLPTKPDAPTLKKLAKQIQRYGQIPITELDALKPDDLEQIIKDNIERHILDKTAWSQMEVTMNQERQSLQQYLAKKVKNL